MTEKVAKFRLKEYKINKANIEFNPSMPISEDISIELERKSMSNEDENLYRLEFGVKIADKEQNLQVYANLIGLFEFDSDIDDRTISIFFNINAPAILFPYVRAYISTLTSLSGIRPIILPTINLANLEGKQN